MSAKLFPSQPILIVDDEETVVTSISDMLKSSGLNNLLACGDSRQVMALVEGRQPAAILLDLGLPHIPGRKLLEELREAYPHIPVVIITGMNEVTAAVECMRAGASDYMVKPVEPSRLASGVKRVLEIRELEQNCRNLKEKLLSASLAKPEAFAHIVTRNKAMHSIFRLIEVIARSRFPILITGETGVGKYLIAQAIHYASGLSGKFVPVNVGGRDDAVIADDLFGHLRGAYTGAQEARGGMIQQAAGGTLLLDEIGDLSPPSQNKLLHLLDTGEYYPLGSDLPRRTDARFVVATNRDLAALMEEGKFRRDLYYRLSTHALRIPPLRERKDDLPLLLGHFLQEAAKELGKEPPSVPPKLLSRLEAYSFPGNIRELRSMVQDAVAKESSGSLSLEPFQEAMDRGGQAASVPDAGTEWVFPERLPTLKKVRELLIEESLKRAHGNQSIAASLLGITHQALNKHLQRKK
jgi:DNA-binding NtrC family response regulator